MDNLTRIFFVVTHEENNEEIFETLEGANHFAEITGGDVGIAQVRNAFKEEDGQWNYEDYSNTFEFIK